MERDLIARLNQAARAQHGVFTLAQARQLGVDQSWLRRSVNSGLLQRPQPRTFLVPASPRTWQQCLAVHVLASGGAATADSALALWCPELAPPGGVTLAVERGRRYDRPGVKTIRSSDLAHAQVTARGGIPTVGVVRALLDAADQRTVTQMETFIDTVRRHLGLSTAALNDGLVTHSRKGRPGVRTLRAAIGSQTSTVPDSEFERQVLRALTRAGPAPVLHHVVRVGGKVFELDLAWPPVRLDVELDGQDHVARARRAREDRARDRLLQAAGWTVLRYTWADWAASPKAVLLEIGAVRRRLGSRHAESRR